MRDGVGRKKTNGLWVAVDEGSIFSPDIWKEGWRDKEMRATRSPSTLSSHPGEKATIMRSSQWCSWIMIPGRSRQPPRICPAKTGTEDA